MEYYLDSIFFLKWLGNPFLLTRQYKLALIIFWQDINRTQATEKCTEPWKWQVTYLAHVFPLSKERQLESIMVFLFYQLLSVPSLAFCLCEESFASCSAGERGSFMSPWNPHLVTVASNHKNKSALGATRMQRSVSTVLLVKVSVQKVQPKVFRIGGKRVGNEECSPILLQHNDELLLLFPKPGSSSSVHLYYLLLVSKGILPY